MSHVCRVLLVDDDDMHLQVARRAIERTKLRAEVVAVGTGGDALKSLGLAAGSPVPARRIAVVLLDLGLPGMSGWGGRARIRGSARQRTRPVVLVSASDRPEDVRRAYESGANSYLVKRHEREQPGNYLAEAARYWVELNVAADPSTAPASAGP